MVDEHNGARAKDIARDLQRRIRAGELLEGTRLIEMELAQKYGVSRTPVRMAFELLERGGLVDLRRQRGAEVKGATTAADLACIREVNGSLFPMLIRLLLNNASDEEINSCLELARAARQQIDSGDSLAGFNTLLHAQRTMVDATHNLPFIQVMCRFEPEQRALLVTVTDPIRVAEALHSILTSVAKRDPNATERLIKEFQEKDEHDRVSSLLTRVDAGSGTELRKLESASLGHRAGRA
ncbi:GntR family transcriptional regulator [Arthrobacter sp. NPDC090010]|uniref:GntR family transcriptional regulator n=1 Tax=Arthrobacter sp. NPDC090010 TaxID=3363942 RepID=UPI00381F761A